MILRVGAFLLLAFGALPALALTPAESTRLQIRAGLGPDPLLARALEPLPVDRAVDRLVDEAAARRVASTPAPAWVDEDLDLPRRAGELSPEERRARQRTVAQRGQELQAWWVQEMLTTASPLAERMTLFWHGHFTSGLREVRAPQLLYRQNELLRLHALGNYRELLHAIVRDPAMLLYLNNQQNRRGAPNENFARELLELFTLGEGHYTEQDVREAARAFTGWRMVPPRGEFRVAARQHDDGEKVVLGRRGRLDGDDVVEAILAQPRAAEFVVEALWREFVTPVPDRAAVRRLAADFRRDWELAPLMKALLRRAARLDARTSAGLVKSPVEFVVGTARALGIPAPPRLLALASARMGQTLFAPPNVRGWPGGDAWITSDSLLARRDFVLRLGGEAAHARRVLAFAERAEALPPDWAVSALLAHAPVTPAEAGATPAQRLLSVLLDPAYQLK